VRKMRAKQRGILAFSVDPCPLSVPNKQPKAGSSKRKRKHIAEFAEEKEIAKEERADFSLRSE
jgi:hypothetical protein